MRGESNPQASMLALINPEDLVPRDHPIREIKRLADAQLKQLSPVFDEMYSSTGRPSIPPERLLKACLLIALFSVRSERQFCEQLAYSLLFKWFLDMDLVEVTFDASTFAKNKDRLLKADVARLFFESVVGEAKGRRLMSADHFTVDGTLIEAWASMKSFRRKGEDPNDTPPDDPGNPTVDFHGEKRRNETHESTTDPEAKLARKGMGKEAKLAFSAHVLMENRNGFCADINVAQATGTAEREEALRMIRRQKANGIRPRTVGADKGYDARNFVDGIRGEGITPHVAARVTGSSLDRRTTTWPSYAISQRCRKKVEEIFGWMKTVGGFRKTRYKGVARTGLWAYLVGTAYNLLRMAKLLIAVEATT
jgi:transposase